VGFTAGLVATVYAGKAQEGSGAREEGSRRLNEHLIVAYFGV